MATEAPVVVDALPYIDQGYDDPGVREAALAMVEEETRRYRPTKNYLDYLPQVQLNLFETEIMKNEFERLQSRLPMEMLSMKRYELPQPPPGKMTDIAAWTECVDNSMAQLEHQATRIANLDLMSQFGCESWKMYNTVIVQMLNQAQKQLQKIRKLIQEVNWHRKNEQSMAGEKLRNLEASWVGLVSKNYEIEQACAELEKECQRMEYERKLQEEQEEIQEEMQQEKPAENITENGTDEQQQNNPVEEPMEEEDETQQEQDQPQISNPDQSQEEEQEQEN